MAQRAVIGCGMIGRIASLLLCIVVGLAPLALGSNRPLPWAYNAVFSGVVCVIVAAMLLLEGRARSLRLALIMPSIILWGVALAWALIQVADLVAGAVLRRDAKKDSEAFDYIQPKMRQVVEYEHKNLLR